MIVRHSPDGVTLVDYEALWVHTGRRPIATIRKYCQPLACDIATQLQLYDAEQSAMILAKVKRRAAHRRVNRTAA